MREMIWLGPDGRRYRIHLLADPLDHRWQSVVFQALDEGWTGAAKLASGYDLLDVSREELIRLLAQAKATD